MANQDKPVVKKLAKAKPAKIKLVKMKGGDRMASVHPDMVEEYRKGGFTEV